MNSRVLISVIVGLVVIGAVLVAVLLRPEPSATNTFASLAATPELADQARRLYEFSNLVPESEPDQRVVLYGDDLIAGNSQILVDVLADGLGRSIEVVPTSGTTTDEALVGLLRVLRTPPGAVVLDIGRYDRAGGLAYEQTIGNLTVISQKFSQLGVKLVVAIGPSSDGSETYAPAVRGGISEPLTFVDVSDLLLTTKYRTSTTALNPEGAKELGSRLNQALKAPLAS